jgi:ATP-dependent Lon protease
MTPEVEAQMRLLKTRAREAIALPPNLPPEIARRSIACNHRRR